MGNKVYMIFGVVILVAGLFSGYKQFNPFWYAIFSIGLFMFLYHYNQFYFKHKIEIRNAFTMYLFYLLAGIVLEFAGINLGLWSYPTYDSLTYYFNVLIVGYPFIFFMVYEIFNFLNYSFESFRNNYWISFITTAVVATFIKEFPNFIYGTKEFYSDVSFSIFSIDLFVYLGWVVMTAFALLPRER